MPSPFPGVDPFIEPQLWPDFHTRFIAELGNALGPRIHPRYVAIIEERVYLEHLPPEQPRTIRVDVSVAARGRGDVLPATSAAPIPAPLTVALPMPEQVTEPFITIRLRDGRDVVAVVELLSPANKRAGSDGRREYLSKREQVLRSEAHLLELDLLRGGERLPVQGELPSADGYVILSRRSRRPLAEVWPLSLREPLPTIPIVLAQGDDDVALDLRVVFSEVYDRAGYHVMLD